MGARHRPSVQQLIVTQLVMRSAVTELSGASSCSPRASLIQSHAYILQAPVRTNLYC
jgi:hypothetical protein